MPKSKSKECINVEVISGRYFNKLNEDIQTEITVNGPNNKLQRNERKEMKRQTPQVYDRRSDKTIIRNKIDRTKTGSLMVF